MRQHRIKGCLRKRQGLLWAIAVLACLATAVPASAQLGSRLGPAIGLPLGIPSITNLPGQVVGDTESAADASKPLTPAVAPTAAAVEPVAETEPIAAA